MNRRIIGFVILLAASVAATAAEKEGRKPVLLELFTSEGCSSCPPADRLLQSLDEQQPIHDADLIVLSEHVDYWNDLGWKDPYAAKLFTRRQQQYADGLGADVYTPQLVIDGQSEGVGSSAVATKNNVQKALAKQKVNLALSNVRRDGSQIKLHVESGEIRESGGPVVLYLALAENAAKSAVSRGENAGRTLIHVAVVRTIVQAGSLHTGGKLSKDVTVEVPDSLRAEAGKLRIVAFLQAENSQRVVAVTQARL